MRRNLSALTTLATATLLAVVTVFVPNLPGLTSPIVLSLMVVAFAIGWPRLVSATPRWGVSAGLAVTGLLSIWVLSLLPATAQFGTDGTDLWLAPVGGAVALGVLLMFVFQTFTLPGGIQRSLATAVLALGAVTVATGAGWTLLLRHKYEAAVGVAAVERITGVTWFMLTVLAAVAAAALVTLLPVRRRTRMMVAVIVATVVGVVLQVFRTGPLSVPAVIAAALVGLLVALVDSFSNTSEVPAQSLGHPMTAMAIGTGTTIASGMISYFVLHVLPW